jgi:HPt (histidine-containing phosphotransfer) domain-containing protein
MTEPHGSEIPDDVLDYPGLLSRLNGDESFARELLTLFLSDVPPKLNDLRRAIESSDTERVERLAHSLKGTSATVKAKRCEWVAFELELAAKAGAAQRWSELGRSLDAEFEAVVDWARERGIATE